MGNSCCNTAKQELKIKYENKCPKDDGYNSKCIQVGLQNNTAEIEHQSSNAKTSIIEKEKLIYLSNTSAKQSYDCDGTSTNNKSSNANFEKFPQKVHDIQKKLDNKTSTSSLDDKEKQGLNIISRIKNISIYKSLSKGSISQKPICIQTNNPKLMLTHISCEQASLNLDEVQQINPNTYISQFKKESKSISILRQNELLKYISMSCWSLILNYLTYSDLRQVGKICSLFNKMAVSPQIYKKFNFSPEKGKAEDINIAQFVNVHIPRIKPKDVIQPKEGKISITLTPKQKRNFALIQCSSPTSLYMSPARANVKRFSVFYESGQDKIENLVKQASPTAKACNFSGSVSDYNFSQKVSNKQLFITERKETEEILYDSHDRKF